MWQIPGSTSAAHRIASTDGVHRGMTTARRRHALRWGWLPLVLAASVTPPVPRARAAEKELTVAIQHDLPPYVMDGAKKGLEVEIVRQALPGDSLRFIQMSYVGLQTAVPKKRAEVAVAVKRLFEDDAFYSRNFITFANVAISKKAAGLKIDDVAGLVGHQVLAWQDAYRELGHEFAKLYAPGGPQRAHYKAFGDQRDQVRAFWAAADDVIVIDRDVFRAFGDEMGHDMSQVVVHPIFPPATNFRVAFASKELRDAFDRGLTALCANGGYAKILASHQVELSRTVCDH